MTKRKLWLGLCNKVTLQPPSEKRKCMCVSDANLFYHMSLFRRARMYFRVAFNLTHILNV